LGKIKISLLQVPEPVQALALDLQAPGFRRQTQGP
jgi:hypothetical protein